MSSLPASLPDLFLARWRFLFCCFASASGLITGLSSKTLSTGSWSSTLKTWMSVLTVTVSPRSSRLKVERPMPAYAASWSWVLFCSMRWCRTNAPMHWAMALSLMDGVISNGLSFIKRIKGFSAWFIMQIYGLNLKSNFWMLFHSLKPDFMLSEWIMMH